MVPHQTAEVVYEATIDDTVYRIRVEETPDSLYTIDLNGQSHVIDSRKLDGSVYSFIIDGQSIQATIEENGTEISVNLGGELWRVRVESSAPERVPKAPGRLRTHARQVITAPIPGKVVKIMVEQGERVKKGQSLVVLEAMKMENEIASLRDGEIKEISVKEGQTVEAGVKLLVIE